MNETLIVGFFGIAPLIGIFTGMLILHIIKPN